MHHERSIAALVGARGNELELATTTFLSGRAEKAHTAGQARRSQECSNCQEGCEARRCNEIVSARVADARQRVVLGIDDDESTSRADLGGEGRGQRVGRRLDRKGEGLQDRYEGGLREMLFICEFRIGVDLQSVSVDSLPEENMSRTDLVNKHASVGRLPCY